MSDRVEVLVTEVFPPHVGGSGRWLSEVYKYRKDEAIVVADELSAEESANGTIRDPLYVKRINLHFSETGGLSLRGFLGYLKRMREISKLTRGAKLSKARAARVVPEGWILWLWYKFAFGPRYDVFAHGEEINLDGGFQGGVMSSRQHRIMARLVFRNAKRVIANSHNTARLLKTQWRLPEHKIVVVHPGVDTEYFKPLDECSSKTLRPDDWNQRFVLLTVGRLQARKGQDRVIETLVALRNTIPNILYVIAGSGEEKNRLQTLVLKHDLRDYVQFRECFNDSVLRSFYQHCDVFILANRQVGSDIEGFGMVLLEAAACGKPTIAGRSGGTSEAVEEGSTGLIVNGDDLDSIYEAVTTLYFNDALRVRLGECGRERAVREFDWKVLSSKIPS